jgi:hypothetical protein
LVFAAEPKLFSFNVRWLRRLDHAAIVAGVAVIAAINMSRKTGSEITN